MNVLSLFDGISAGQIALERAGIEVDNYFASEIDKYAISITKKNYPNTKHIGDVKNVDVKNLPKIDLIIGGSPCHGFSFAGKQLNFKDPRSALFFEFVRILKEAREINTDVKFMLENVRMKKEYLDVITGHLGVNPTLINSNLLSAQNRQRYYWTNICELTQPEDKGILLKDIVHEYADLPAVKITERNMKEFKKCLNGKSNCLAASCYKGVGNNGMPLIFQKELEHRVTNFNVNPSGKGMNGVVRSIQNDKSSCVTTNKGEGYKISIPLEEYIVPFDKTLKILDKEVEKGKVGFFRKDSQANRVYYIHGKAITLCGASGGGAEKMGQYLFGCITPDRLNKRQNGQRFNTGRKFYTLTAQDKHGILVEGYIRKLTPIECERLQTIKDNFTSGVSNSQRYKCLGNSWTVDVIVHILKNLK